MDNPLISVVIPVYNGSNYMREAVESVLAQTYTNYEILLIDDGSKDNTWEIIQEYMQKYPDKIRGFHKENGGVSTALNLGISEMKGEWFAWLSHDDLWLPENLETKINIICANPGYGMYYGGYRYVDDKARFVRTVNGIWYPHGKDLRKMLRRGNYINGISILIPKETITTIGLFNSNLRCAQELEFWFRIAKKYMLYNTEDTLVETRLHPLQVGNVRRNLLHEEYAQLRLSLLNSIEWGDLYPNKSRKTLGISIYILYLKTCIKYNIPTYDAAISGFAKRVKLMVKSR